MLVAAPQGGWLKPSLEPPLILLADNGNTMRVATLESRLEEMGVLN